MNMNIELKKFGTTLTSRQSGKEAFLAFSPTLNVIKDDEMIIVDFDGVNTFTPGWGDEFLRQLHNKFGARLILKSTDNPSAKATITIIEQTNNMKFQIQ